MFQAAVIAVPIAGGLILVILILMAVRMLREDYNRRSDSQTGLMKAVLDRDLEGNLIRKAGVMGIVLKGGEININDTVEIQLPTTSHAKLEVV